MGPAVVLVDARNVLRSRWPNIPERELVDLCRAWSEETAQRLVVVFDGEAPGGPAGEPDASDSLLLIGTGPETADEWLVRAAERLRAIGAEFSLVTSDRALRARAGRGAVETIGGGTFARRLGALREHRG